MPARAQHSASLKAITARQLQAHVRQRPSGIHSLRIVTPKGVGAENGRTVWFVESEGTPARASYMLIEYSADWFRGS